MKHNEYRIGTCGLCRSVTALKNGACVKCNEGKTNFASYLEKFYQVLGLNEKGKKK